MKAIEGVNKFWRRKLIMSCSDAGKFFDIFSLIPKSNIILSLSPPPPTTPVGEIFFFIILVIPILNNTFIRV